MIGSAYSTTFSRGYITTAGLCFCETCAKKILCPFAWKTQATSEFQIPSPHSKYGGFLIGDQVVHPVCIKETRHNTPGFYWSVKNGKKNVKRGAKSNRKISQGVLQILSKKEWNLLL